MPWACPEQSVAQLAAQRACSIRQTARHTILFPAPPSPLLPEYYRGATGRSRRKRGIQLLRHASHTLCLQRSRYGQAQTMVVELDRTPPVSRWHPFPPRHPVRVSATSWTQATPRRHLLAQDGTRGPAPSAVTAHNGHGGTRAGWYAALVGGLLSALLLMTACAPRMGGPASLVQDKPVGAVQNEARRGAPLSGTDGCTWSEVLGECRVHNE